MWAILFGTEIKDLIYLFIFIYSFVCLLFGLFIYYLVGCLLACFIYVFISLLFGWLLYLFIYILIFIYFCITFKTLIMSWVILTQTVPKDPHNRVNRVYLFREKERNKDWWVNYCLIYGLKQLYVKPGIKLQHQTLLSNLLN